MKSWTLYQLIIHSFNYEVEVKMVDEKLAFRLSYIEQ